MYQQNDIENLLKTIANMEERIKALENEIKTMKMNNEKKEVLKLGKLAKDAKTNNPFVLARKHKKTEIIYVSD
ncbi:hypothetical protein CVT24_008495 [Panaeolus cyanescens]|uniref:Uncharacterized protein n=1 Tax=Panaeolus cyanescens TaxID=181874 RepID=A0A409XC29_9AGAR|nr:hypothetical protein CVT24_008495 [Panaeolus cyanescens]